MQIPSSLITEENDPLKFVVLGLDENQGNGGLRVGTYFRLTLGSRKMIGCVDIGLAILQDMLGPGR